MDAHALHRRGWTISAIARHLGHDRKTIRAYLSGSRVVGQRRRADPDPFEPFAGYCRERLGEDPHLWATTLFDELLELGYDRSYPTFTRQLRARGLRPACEPCRPAKDRPVAVIEHPPGEETQFDWLELPDPPQQWGWGSKAFLLVGALAHSGRWRGVLAESTDQPHVIDALHRICVALGGLTRTWRFDRMATVCHPATGRVTASFAAVADVQHACAVFHDTWQATGGVDGRVSLEVDPRLARDTDATLAEAKELWKAVDRPNLLVKIPATEAGLAAITGALAQGISVNVTLIFSVERYRAVMGAYLDGLEQAAANGQNLATIASVASFFVSRVDTEIDARLEKIGTDEALALRGKAAVANSRLAYAAFQEVFSGPRWEALAGQGATAQRPLWASTGVKNPDHSDTLYVTELVVADTVNTMPEKTLLAFTDHGELHAGGDVVTGTAVEAQKVFDAVAAVGVDITDVFLALENDGVDKFEQSWSQLWNTVTDQLDKAR